MSCSRSYTSQWQSSAGERVNWFLFCSFYTGSPHSMVLSGLFWGWLAGTCNLGISELRERSGFVCALWRQRVIILMEWFLGGIDRPSLNSNNPFVSQQGLEGGYFLRQSCELLLSPVSSHELSEKIQGTHMSQCEHIKLWRVNKDGDYRLP